MAVSHLIGFVCLAVVAGQALAARDCSWQPACPAEGEHTFAIPCENSCNKYYQCKDGQLSKGTCGVGLSPKMFDPVKKQCVYGAVDCAWYLKDDSMCGFTPKCPAKGKANLAIPCEGFCKQYIKCRDGQWTLATCANSRFQSFNAKTAHCDASYKVDCSWFKSQ